MSSVQVVVSNERNREYYDSTDAESYWVELVQGGHMTFASVDQYNENLGNGIGRCASCCPAGDGTGKW